MNMRWLVRGLGLGAGLTYFFDPEFGRRRRAILRDKVIRAGDAAEDAAGKTSRDLGNRLRGLAAEARARLRKEAVSDEVLVERVRSKMGRVVSHSGAIEVSARDGLVTLSGPVLAMESDALVDCVLGVRGVRAVENRLEAHEQAGDVPGLQGGTGRREPRPELAPSNWSPARRFVAGLSGGSLAAWGLRRRSLLGSAAAGGGLLLLGRAATNLEWKRLLGLGASGRGIDLRKTLHVNAPVEEVFRFWSSFENFPKFLSHVREVRDNGQGYTHWEVDGPAGVPVDWDAVVTAYVPNQLIAWKTVPGEAIRHSGIVRFDAAPDGSTRLEIRMTYKPPAGAVGHAVATLFATDPKHTIDDDLVRFKSLLETGRTTARRESVSKEELETSETAAGPAPTARAGEAGEEAGEIGIAPVEPSGETEGARPASAEPRPRSGGRRASPRARPRPPEI